MKKLIKFGFFVVAIFVAIISAFAFYQEASRKKSCEIIGNLANDELKIKYLRELGLGELKPRENFINNLVDSKFESDWFKELGLSRTYLGLDETQDHILIGINTENIKDKTSRRVSLSLLLNRCCYLKIPLEKDKAMELSREEKRITKYKYINGAFETCEYDRKTPLE